MPISHLECEELLPRLTISTAQHISGQEFRSCLVHRYQPALQLLQHHMHAGC